MKNILLIFSVTVSYLVLAQEPEPSIPPAVESNWKRDLQTGLNINQATYSENWKSGGTNSIALGTFLNGKATYKQAKHEWITDIQLLYGTIANEGQSVRKNADRIFIDSKYGYKLTDKWGLFASATFMSQFDAGFEYSKLKDSTGKETGEELTTRISGFMSPGYLTEAIGFEYKPADYFSAQFGVGALRQSFVLDQTLYDRTGKAELYGVGRGEKMRNQVIFQFVANFDKEIVKNVVLKARYMAQIDYAKINGQGIVHRLDANLTAKVNRYINVNMAGVVLYDYDQDSRVQHSQVLSLGILYTIKNYRDQ